MGKWLQAETESAMEWWVADGLTADEISRKLMEKFGTVRTRNAVLGHIHRHKLRMTGAGAASIAAMRSSVTDAKLKERRMAAEERKKEKRESARSHRADAETSRYATQVHPASTPPEGGVSLSETKDAISLSDGSVRPGLCKWPLDMSLKKVPFSQFRCCGASTYVPGRPYCDEHLERARGKAQPAHVIKAAKASAAKATRNGRSF